MSRQLTVITPSFRWLGPRRSSSPAWSSWQLLQGRSWKGTGARAHWQTPAAHTGGGPALTARKTRRFPSQCPPTHVRSTRTLQSAPAPFSLSAAVLSAGRKGRLDDGAPFLWRTGADGEPDVQLWRKAWLDSGDPFWYTADGPQEVRLTDPYVELAVNHDEL